MMATILNSAILDSAILHKTLTQTILIWHNLIHSHSAWWWQPSWILPSWILPSWILPSWIQPFSSKKNVTHSFWLNLMMEAILNTAILDSDTAIMGSDTLLSSLRFTQKHSPSTLILTQTNWIWLTRWRQPSWILPSWIQPFEQKKLHSFILTQIDDCRKSWILLSWIQPFCTKKTSLIHSDWTWWWQPSWILPYWIETLLSWIQTPCYLLSDSLKNTLPPLWPWLKLIQSD